jgi:hypothetical protein
MQMTPNFKYESINPGLIDSYLKFDNPMISGWSSIQNQILFLHDIEGPKNDKYWLYAMKTAQFCQFEN